jgi:general secretion pathway protein M
MTQASTFTTGRLGAYALTAAVLIALALAAIAPHVAYLRMEEQLAGLQALRDNLQRQLTAQRRSVNQSESGEAPGKSVENLLLAAPTRGLAEAQLQKTLTSLVAQHQGVIASVQVLPPKQEQNLTRVTVRLTMQIGIDGLRDVLFEIETRTPFLFIDDFIVKTPSENPRQRSASTGLGPYEVSIAVHGYTLATTAPSQ